MSNVTLQVALNKGYTVIAQESVTPNNPAVAIPAHSGTNKILLSSNTIDQGIYLGASNVTTNGLIVNFPTAFYDGSSEVTRYTQQLIEIDTDSPEDFYLFAGGPGGNVNVLYLALNT